MAMAHQYMFQLMKNGIGFAYNERDVKADSVAYKSILSKQEKLCKLATGKLPFNTKVSNKSKPKVKPVKEEPVKEEPVKEEPVKKEPVKKEPVKKEPVKKEPVKEELVKEEPVKEEPLKKEPVKEEPVKEEPVKEEPVKKEPVKEEPVKEEPVKEKVDSIIETKTPTGCTYKMMRGERRGESCNKPCSKDSAFCKTHK